MFKQGVRGRDIQEGTGPGRAAGLTESSMVTRGRARKGRVALHSSSVPARPSQSQSTRMSSSRPSSTACMYQQVSTQPDSFCKYLERSVPKWGEGFHSNKDHYILDKVIMEGWCWRQTSMPSCRCWWSGRSCTWTRRGQLARGGEALML